MSTHRLGCGLQPAARGVDRVFRLFREDQVSSIRDALHNATAERPSKPRPTMLQNAAIVRPDKNNARPLFHMEFDFPAPLLMMSAAEKVCA